PMPGPVAGAVQGLRLRGWTFLFQFAFVRFFSFAGGPTTPSRIFFYCSSFSRPTCPLPCSALAGFLRLWVSRWQRSNFRDLPSPTWFVSSPFSFISCRGGIGS